MISVSAQWLIDLVIGKLAVFAADFRLKVLPDRKRLDWKV